MGQVGGGGVAGKPLKANQGLGKESVATAASCSGLPSPLWLPLRKKKTRAGGSSLLPVEASLAPPRSPHLAQPSSTIDVTGPQHTMFPALEEAAARAAPEQGPGVTISPQHPSPLKDDENLKPQPSGSAQSTAPTPG